MAQAKISDSIPDADCLSIEDLALEFNLKTQRMRQVVDKAVKERIIPNLIKVKGRKNLYPPQFVEQLKLAVDAGKLGKFNKRTSKSAMKYADLVIQVPIFDKEIAFMLRKKFKDEEGITKFLQNQAAESVKPIMAKKRELQERYENELQKLLHSTDFA